MRIAGGEFRGRVLRLPKGVDLRPTEERVRLALFNIVAPMLPGARFLDLCCGSGAVGIEALSRGAAFAGFGDKETRCLKSVREHLETFGIGEDRYEILPGDYVQVLSRCETRPSKFQLIFVDPPYGSPLLSDALQRVASLDILERGPGSRLILEHDSKLELPEREGSLGLFKRYPYGKSSLSLYGFQDAD